jgi:hypothetical protein
LRSKSAITENELLFVSIFIENNCFVNHVSKSVAKIGSENKLPSIFEFIFQKKNVNGCVANSKKALKY